MLCAEEKMSTVNSVDLHYDAIVVGLGKTGLSCFRYLSNQGLSVAITDSRETPPELSKLQEEFESAPTYLGQINEKALLASDQIILSPGISLDHKSIKLSIENNIPVFGDIELFCQEAKAPIIAISGSNGKSTVTTMVAEMTRSAGLKTYVGGNIGTPALDLLDDTIPDLYVLELSSFQLETTFSLNAHASVVLNISPDHMDRYSSFHEYADAKKRIYLGQGFMVVNKDEEYFHSVIDDNREIIYFTLTTPEEGNYGLIINDKEVWLSHGSNKIINKNQLKIRGEHNVSNALAAMALAETVDVPKDVMTGVLKEFVGLAHRCQLIKVINDVTWYNDSKATNVESCIASIKGLSELGDIILIAGGDSKEADLSCLRAIIEKYVKKVFLLGIDASKLASFIGPDIEKKFVKNMNEAVAEAGKIASSGDIVLLSPACSSLDMYTNYQQRGDAFISAVNALSNNV
ncbi:MAG: UDP-N-acetylmuramoyl-L-alanine--D-glutamate ligase [Legionellales bacterium]|nr:UDP-N-acetylmuramoyl-L-alanine--D-glutamate ligase [Legionellales bacterium]HBH11128.1 UDP-N-acetylmuramoyl-L-alanine--D-glutamate ligase [Gammaproteobacteria bacterium]